MKRIVIIIATIMTLMAGMAQSRPSLLVDITVNGLDYRRLTELAPYFCDGGFKRLMNQGVTIAVTDFGSRVDDTAAAAILATGASPAINGVTGETRFDGETRRGVNIFHDSEKIGNYTDETLSPAALRVSTLSDEVRLDAAGLGNVYALAPDASQAIISAGHAGNSGCWITDSSGKWATTTYYKDLPYPITAANQRQPLSVRIDTVSWTPLFKNGAMDFVPAYKRAYSFRHYFSHSDPNRFRAFKTAAPVNTEVANLAIEYLKNLSLGKRETIDMLALTFTLQPYVYGRESDNRAELIDSYMRLDRELQRLFKEIDAVEPGMGKTMVVVAGTPATLSCRPDDEKWGIPTGNFSPERAVSLLKMNLMASYGNGDWVIGYHDKQFFLNRQLIHDRNLNLEDVAKESADFLRKMSGVTFAATLGDIVAGNSRATTFPPLRNIDVDSAGDIFVTIAPGWTIARQMYDTALPETAERIAPSTSAAFILAPGLKPAVIDYVDARVIAPTVASLLYLRAPNGASLPPLRL